MTTLNVVTYNIHKGLSHFNQRIVLHELRERLRELNADIVFLQEVQGEKYLDGRHLPGSSTPPQHEFLADQIWPHHVYGKNSVYIGGHHGNALLSRHSIVKWDNLDISAHRFESRGLLHCVIDLPKTDKNVISQPLHCICVHFGLFKRGRGVQLSALIERIKQMVPEDARLIVAGDFNDWRNYASRLLANNLNLHEVFEENLGRPARSFPAGIPLLCMDRIYVRGLEIQRCEVHAWRKISDHVALSATLNL
ncbi:endonuclease/exonuclease/phosphatase family protein [Candidatus Nitrotoga sp. M5]|uniref:endonuclease/exonuclease/phosphatase family protein n=1 Tax=Candidatus Nitrotoga sp. M5 TaxID=2890409 RepID=UPI001EF53357|nr:endonuclease/exonuclease/phosphatase family protein [Candidatus Nitrotoga sp. M5]CAH1387894.1 endonuclease/exonuclease/phosphatase domain-containing protein YbhP [Candidatus Nitrotoga sp. M5]